MNGIVAKQALSAAIMSRLFIIWLDICLLRAGPQDLPASRELQALAMAAYVLVSFLLSLPGYPPGTAAAVAVVDLALLVALATVALQLAGRRARIRQTLTALAGCGALLGLAALPVVHSLAAVDDPGEIPLLTAVAWVVLFGWSLLVVAHIMRHALAVPLALGAGVAILYMFVAMQVIGTLFPVAIH